MNLIRKIPMWLRITALALAVLLLTWAILALLPRGQNYAPENPMQKDGKLPILIAHGGGNREFPDNTLEAFYNAYSVDSNVMMETDVSITKDGVVILSHDTTLDRKTNVTGNICDWNYSALLGQEVDFGYTNPTDENDRLSGDRVRFTTDEGEERRPTDVTYPEGITARHESVFLVTRLEELIIAFPNNRINVEIKQSGDTGLRALREVLRIVHKHNAYDRVVLASFHDEIYAEYQRLQNENMTSSLFMCSPSVGGATSFFILQMLGLDVFFGDRMCVFQLPMEQKGFHLATEGLIDAAHKHNLAVHYWTINDKEDMQYLIDIGADGIMTDYPHRLKEVYEENQK